MQFLHGVVNHILHVADRAIGKYAHLHVSARELRRCEGDGSIAGWHPVNGPGNGSADQNDVFFRAYLHDPQVLDGDPIVPHVPRHSHVTPDTPRR